jgi:hypothetical protein
MGEYVILWDDSCVGDYTNYVRTKRIKNKKKGDSYHIVIFYFYSVILRGWVLRSPRQTMAVRSWVNRRR